MRKNNFNSRERLLFFDAVICWTREINKELDYSASSSEVVEAYKILSTTHNSFLKAGDGNWVKSIGEQPKSLLKNKVMC